MANTKATVEMEKALEPMHALNKLMLDNAAKMVEMNLNVTKRYADIALGNVREVMEIKDPAALQAYVAKQPESIKTFAETARADAEAAMKLSLSYFEAAGKVVSESAKKAA